MSEPKKQLAINYERSELYFLVKNLSQLPFEIQAMISSYSSNSLLWKFAIVCALAEDLTNLREGNVIVKELPLHRWVRGTSLEQHSGSPSEQGLVRFGLDGLGIRVCQVLENTNTTDIPLCTWYIVEKASSLQGLRLESSVSKNLSWLSYLGTNNYRVASSVSPHLSVPIVLLHGGIAQTHLTSSYVDLLGTMQTLIVYDVLISTPSLDLPFSLLADLHMGFTHIRERVRLPLKLIEKSPAHERNFSSGNSSLCP